MEAVIIGRAKEYENYVEITFGINDENKYFRMVKKDYNSYTIIPGGVIRERDKNEFEKITFFEARSVFSKYHNKQPKPLKRNSLGYMSLKGESLKLTVDIPVWLVNVTNRIFGI